MASYVESTSNYIKVFLALLVLTALTVTVAYMDFGGLNTPIAICIAVIKALFVLLIFMHLRHSHHLIAIFVATAFATLLILFGLILGDYQTRNMPNLGHQDSWIRAKHHGKSMPGEYANTLSK